MMSIRSGLAILSVALPVLLLGGELSLMALKLLPAVASPASAATPAIAAPATTEIGPGTFDYRRSGAFLRAGDPVDGPVRATTIPSTLEVTTDLISAADYLRCVADGACEPVKGTPDRADLPITGVSFDDASAYAAWLSVRTGSVWRLPTDLEWAFAAGARFNGAGLDLDDSNGNPSLRWLAAYRQSADREPPRGPQPAGTYGANESGLNDLAGNVWEWTSSCYERTTLNVDGRTISVVENCGVRVAEGVHRAYISRFIRDAKGGGCAAGVPPELLGFRLVREASWRKNTLAFLPRLIGIEHA